MAVFLKLSILIKSSIFYFSFEDWLAESGESMVSKDKFSYPNWRFHRRKRLLEMQQPKNHTDSQYFWTKLKDSVKKLRDKHYLKKTSSTTEKPSTTTTTLPKKLSNVMLQTAQEMMHTLLIG